ncbi:TBC1 domain family member 30-like [Perognathus longimembris pacificus]|uniref:TBC1 domain family member 30-like n=1 Tax=Perognathus longimembris pacificus TaxID=214514 RepID=UPI002018F4AA|nr:TBC1 domain family member 30-like [Perognathus longimembris pacificus]
MEVGAAARGRTELPALQSAGRARLEDGVPGVSLAPPAPPPPGSRDSWEAEEEPGPRTSRTASLVSGLLTELYSCPEEEEAAAAGGARGGPGGHGRRHPDSPDSSTEASGSDAVLGGRGVGDSRALQELRERPSQELQRRYLRQKDLNELKMILQELKYRTGVQSAKLLRQLKQKDRLLHKVQRNCDIVTACLQAVSPKRSKCGGAGDHQFPTKGIQFISRHSCWHVNVK